MEIRLTINNSDLEQQLLQFIKQKHKSLEETVIEAIKKLITPTSEVEFDYVKKDPKKHSRKIEYKEDFTLKLDDSVKPYSHIEDSGKYNHDLRRKRNC